MLSFGEFETNTSTGNQFVKKNQTVLERLEISTNWMDASHNLKLSDNGNSH